MLARRALDPETEARKLTSLVPPHEARHGRAVLKDRGDGRWQSRIAEPPAELAAEHAASGTRVALKRSLERFGLLGPALRVHSVLRTRGWFRWAPLVAEQEFSATCDVAIATLLGHDHAFGDYLEFGVSRGTSMTCMYRALHNAGLSRVRLIGFDSFKGMPNEAAGQGWVPGLYASSIGATRRHLKEAGVDLNGVQLVKGWFRDTLTPKTVARLDLQKASLIMMDCDIYTSSKQALLFCEPLIVDRTVIIFDDWGARADVGEIGQQEAYAEFLEAFPHFTSDPLPAHIPQARMFLVTRRRRTSGPGDGLSIQAGQRP